MPEKVTSLWGKNQATMVDEPAVFVNNLNLRPFALRFKLMIQNGESKNFFLYTVFFKKEKRNCAAWPNLPISCINFEKLYDVQEGPEMRALSIFLLGFTDQCGNLNFI